MNSTPGPFTLSRVSDDSFSQPQQTDYISHTITASDTNEQTSSLQDLRVSPLDTISWPISSFASSGKTIAGSEPSIANGILRILVKLGGEDRISPKANVSHPTRVSMDTQTEHQNPAEATVAPCPARIENSINSKNSSAMGTVKSQVMKLLTDWLKREAPCCKYTQKCHLKKPKL
ncbi:hypothetical protein PoB_002658700 [Plakobranchus ocellatus]|uniref:Uncharacterized protein n=1 Tax=Plakobranchus ocellatus TaxID=259542 RepID=A0AAV3ZYD0_9GAST|nr:hypothetical protein PoB_002658700 [Plakobranchus ocellatus]